MFLFFFLSIPPSYSLDLRSDDWPSSSCIGLWEWRPHTKDSRELWKEPIPLSSWTLLTCTVYLWTSLIWENKTLLSWLFGHIMLKLTLIDYYHYLDSPLWLFLLSSQRNTIISLVHNFPYLSHGLMCTHRKIHRISFGDFMISFFFPYQNAITVYILYILFCYSIYLVSCLVHSEAYAFRCKTWHAAWIQLRMFLQGWLPSYMSVKIIFKNNNNNNNHNHLTSKCLENMIWLLLVEVTLEKWSC